MNRIYMLVLIGSTGLTSIFNFLAQVLIARNTQPYIYGVYSVYNTLLLMSIPLVTLGMGHYIIKVNAEKNEKKGYLTINHLLLIFMSSVIGFIFIFFFLKFYFNDLSIFDSFFLSFGILAYAYFELFQSYLIGTQNKKFLVVWQPYLHFVRFLILLFLIYVLGMRGDLNLVVNFTILFSLVVFFTVWILRSHIIKYNKLDYELKEIFKIFKSSVWYGMVGFLYVIYTQLSVILIDYNLDAVWAGYYNIGITFVLMSLILPNTIYYKYYLPKLHFYMKNNKNKLQSFYIKGAIISIIIGALIAVLLFLSSSYLISVFYGKKYLVADGLFKTIVFSIPLFYLNIHLGVFTLLGNFQKYKFYVLLLVTLVSVFFSMVLISYFGAFGAAYSLFLVLLVMAIAYYYVNKIIVLGR